MDAQQLAETENVCQAMFSGASAGDPHIQGLLDSYKDVTCIGNCTFLLTHSRSPYAQLFGATSLLGLATKSYTTLDMSQRLHLRAFVLNFLWENPMMNTVVLVPLMQLMGRLTKFGWFDGNDDTYPFRDTPTELSKFMQGSLDQCAVGIHALSILVSEVNDQGSIRSFTLQRKIASSFRDVSMLGVFELALGMLRRVTDKEIPAQGPGQRLVAVVLQLTLACLTFDFIGTAPDESIDDSAAVEVPSSWRQVIMEPTTLKLLFDLYALLDPPLKSKAMEIIVQMGSVRRSLFVKDERMTYLASVVGHTIAAIRAQEGLNDPDSYHQVCRLLARIKIHELYNILDEPMMNDFVQLVGEFTLSSIRSWQYSANSFDYLLSLWSKLVSQMAPRNKTMPPSQVERYAPQITREFLEMRIKAVEVIMGMKGEDPLDEREELLAQLDKLSTIARCQYEEAWRFLVSILDSLLASYQEQVNAINQNTATLTVLDRQLAWVVYTVGAIVGGRTATMQTGNADVMDGELAVKVFLLMQITDARRDRAYDVLEFALINFFRNFSKIYIGSHVQKSSKIFALFSEHLGLSDQLMVLHVFVQRIVSDLKVWVEDTEVVDAALQLLSEWSVGYTTVRMLLKLEPIQFVLKNHTSATFPFLGLLPFMHARSVFFACLGQMLFVTIEGGSEDEQMEEFMSPFMETSSHLASLFAVETNESLYKNHDAKYAVMGMARDIRGLVSAAHNKNHYMLLFNCLYPHCTQLMQRAVQIWCDDPAFTQSVLKFLLEFVTNRNKRIEFDVASANGILLFKQSSNILSEYANRLLSFTDESTDAKIRRYKGVTKCLEILQASLSGKYTNFGVFRLYGDDTLDRAFNVFLVIIQAVPLNELLTYPKLGRAYYSLLETLSEDHISFLGSLEPAAFAYLMSSLYDGIAQKDQKSAAQACTVLDALLSSHLKAMFRSGRPGYTPNRLAYLLDNVGDMLPRILAMMLQAIMFEDCQLYWSLSRPMLCLILMNEKYFVDISREFLNSQAQERQPELQKCFEALMQGIENNLTQRNRDLFTKNINNFRREISNHIRTQSPGDAAGEPGIDMMS